MVNNVLYVGMMYDITSLINLEESVDNIYVIDIVDLGYGQFIKDKKNSWETLKERIKNILRDGFNINDYNNIKQINKLGKAEIIFEEDIIKYDIKDDIKRDIKDDYGLSTKHKWTLKFKYEKNGKIINMIFYGGYCSEEIWELDIQNINCIMSMGSYFYNKINDNNNYDMNTKNMIKDRCVLPLSHYTLYFICNKYYDKINTIYHDQLDNIQNVELNDEIGKVILTDFSDNNLNNKLLLI